MSQIVFSAACLAIIAAVVAWMTTRDWGQYDTGRRPVSKRRMWLVVGALVLVAGSIYVLRDVPELIIGLHWWSFGK